MDIYIYIKSISWASLYIQGTAGFQKCSGPVFDLIYHGLRKVSQLQTLLRSIEVECMPQTFSLSMEVVSYLHLPYLQDIPRFDGRYKAEEVQPLVY